MNIDIDKELTKKIAMGSFDPDVLLGFLEKELALPNFPCKVNKKEKNWITLAKFNGWVLQQNMITRHARIVNRHNIRVAWGTVNGMNKAFERMVKYMKKYDGNDLGSRSSKKSKRARKKNYRTRH